MSMSIQSNEVKSAVRGRHIYVSAATHERLVARKTTYLNELFGEPYVTTEDVSNLSMDEVIRDLLRDVIELDQEPVYSADAAAVINLQQSQLARLERENALLQAKLRAVGSIAGKPTASTSLSPFEAALAAAGWEARGDFPGWYYCEETEEQMDEDDLRVRLGSPRSRSRRGVFFASRETG